MSKFTYDEGHRTHLTSHTRKDVRSGPSSQKTPAAATIGSNGTKAVQTALAAITLPGAQTRQGWSVADFYPSSWDPSKFGKYLEKSVGNVEKNLLTEDRNVGTSDDFRRRVAPLLRSEIVSLFEEMSAALDGSA